MRLETPSHKPRLISTAQLGQELGFSSKTIEKWRHEGCPHVKLTARTYRYDLAKVEAWLEARSEAQKGAA